MAECIAMSCPRLSNPDPDNRALAITVPPSLITRDKQGNSFCNFCQHARQLMDYGHDHGWPEVRSVGVSGRYLILNGHAEWYLSIACGDKNLIEAFYAELIGSEE